MNVYFKQQLAGEYLYIPNEWEVVNYHYEKGFIDGSELSSNKEYRLPYFFSLVNLNKIFTNTKDIYEELTKYIDFKSYTFWLIYHYGLFNNNFMVICLLASNYDYFKEVEYEDLFVCERG